MNRFPGQDGLLYISSTEELTDVSWLGLDGKYFDEVIGKLAHPIAFDHAVTGQLLGAILLHGEVVADTHVSNNTHAPAVGRDVAYPALDDLQRGSCWSYPFR